MTPAHGHSVRANRPFLITFSGIDGAGKTTQIEHVSLCLKRQGLRVLRLTFWDHIAIWSKMRTGAGIRAADLIDAERITERAFSPKNHKHIRKWYLTMARSGFYVLDVARLHYILARAGSFDVVIFDRYVYDQVANIYSQAFAARVYARLLLRHTPTPDLAFVLNASPDAAFARKPEYPLDFVHRNREQFLQLRELVPGLIVIPEGAVDEVRSEINFHISQSRLVERESLKEKTPVIPAQRSTPAPEFL